MENYEDGEGTQFDGAREAVGGIECLRQPRRLRGTTMGSSGAFSFRRFHTPNARGTRRLTGGTGARLSNTRPFDSCYLSLPV